MPTLPEWIECRAADGRALPLGKCNAYRQTQGLPPLDSPAAPEVSRKPTVQQPLPPLWKRAWNFVSASTQHLNAGRPKCSEEQIQARLAICEACDLFDGKHCRECGCACNGTSNFMNKLAWADQECPHPAGPKWGKLDGPA